MNKRKLPIGIQTFRKIREETCYYVDKTAYIRRIRTARGARLRRVGDAISGLLRQHPLRVQQ